MFLVFNLDVFAVSREVDLDDEAWDVLTVSDPVQGRSQRKVVEIHCTFNWTHSQEPIVWTEPGPQETHKICAIYLRYNTEVLKGEVLPYVLLSVQGWSPTVCPG